MKALIIRFGSLGDILLTLPALRDLADSGATEIHYLCLEEYGELLAPLPQIRRIWTLPRGSQRAALGPLAADLAGEGYDLVLDLHGNLRSRLLRRGLRAARRVAPARGRAARGPRWRQSPRYDLRRRALVASSRLLERRSVRLLCPPVAQRHRDTVARALGTAYRRAPFLPYPVQGSLREAVDHELADLGLASGQRPLALAPGAAWPAKVWPHFDALLDLLPRDQSTLVFGGPDDETRCHELARGDRAIAYCGSRPLPRVAAALARCRLLVTGDTGLGHLAEALGIPVLVLFGPTVPAFGFAPQGAESRWLERDLSCRPCSLHGEKACRFGHLDCLAGLSAQRVLDTLGETDAI